MPHCYLCCMRQGKGAGQGFWSGANASARLAGVSRWRGPEEDDAKGDEEAMRPQ